MHGGKEKYFLDIWKQEVPDCKFPQLYLEKRMVKEAAIAVPRCYGASATVLRATVLRKESHHNITGTT